MNGITLGNEEPSAHPSVGTQLLYLPAEPSLLSKWDSIQPRVLLRPRYDFTPEEDPTVVCANKTTPHLF